MRNRRDYLPWWLCAAVIVSGLWTASDVAGLFASLLLISWGIVLHWLARSSDAQLDDSAVRLAGRPGGVELLLGVVIATPLLVWLILFRPVEFPFIGDHNVHLRHLLAAGETWRPVWLVALAMLLLVLPRVRGALPGWTPVAIMGAWMLGGVFVDPASGFATRYPGTLHFLAVPIAALCERLQSSSPLDAIRIANALALPAWMFVLRPLCLKRWPGISVLPFAVFLFFQKDVVYYFSSAYLEPWSLVMFALAVELLVTGEARDSWKAVLAAFAAPMIKEYTILLAVFIAIGAYLRAREKRDRLQVVLSAMTGTLVFGFYYTARLRTGVFGASGFDPSGLGPGRLAGYAERAGQQFGSAFPIVVALAAALVLLVLRRGIGWRTWAPLAAGIIVHNFYFLGEKLTTEWLGYPRFQIPVLAFMAAPLLLLPSLPKARNWILGVSLLIAVAHLLSARPLIAAIGKPEVTMNFFEHRDAPVYLPFRQLVEEADRRGWTAATTRLRVLSNLHGVKRGYVPVALPLAYPDLAERFAIEVGPLDHSSFARCTCTATNEPVIGLYAYFNGAETTDAPVVAIKEAATRCHERIARSCTSSFAFRYHDQLVGSFGMGPRGAPAMTRGPQ